MVTPHGLVVQRVLTSWTKVSRGGVAAASRNQVPRAFRLPVGAVLHQVQCREESGFAPAEVTFGSWDDVSAESRHELGVFIEGDEARVLPNINQAWAPSRTRRPPRKVVRAGEWIRWAVNYQGLERGWQYGLVTFNIDFRPPADAGVFLGEPSCHIEELEHLR